MTMTGRPAPRRAEQASSGRRVADWFDGRLGTHTLGRKYLRKVFPDHWSFLLGEICLYSFVVLILTGVYLTLFFHPSMNEVTYHGSYVPLNGVRMSEAYASTLDISFDVRGGLLIRQIHHWAALIFVAGMLMHMMRHFFTGSFRKPREINWLFGWTLLLLGMFEGCSATRCRTICCPAPVSGSWTARSFRCPSSGRICPSSCSAVSFPGMTSSPASTPCTSW